MLSLQMRTRAAAAFGFLFAVAAPLGVQAAANKPTAALEDFQKAFAGINDYQFRIVTHETTDDREERRGPRLSCLGTASRRTRRCKSWQGRDKGGAATWHGGDTVSGHHGGFLSGIHLTKSIHDRDATSLRGDILISDAYDMILKHFEETPGSLSEAPGPVIDSQATTAVTLAVADPKANANVSKDVIYLSNLSHLPLGRDQYVGSLHGENRKIQRHQNQPRPQRLRLQRLGLVH